MDAARPSLCAHSAEAGFSVIEALVAIAILAAALIPLLGLQGQFSRSVTSLETTEARLSVQDIVAQTIAATNLSVQDTGTFRLPEPDMTVSWSAKPVTGARPVRDRGGARSRYDMTLYDVTATVSSRSGRDFTVSLRGLGWVETRGFLENL